MIAVTVGIVVRDLIVGFSVFAAGACVYMGVRSIQHRREDYWWAFALVGIALGGIVYLIADLVARAPTVMLGWRTFLYTGLLLAGGIGVLGVVRARGSQRSTRGPSGSAVLTVTVLLIVTQSFILVTLVHVAQDQTTHFQAISEQLGDSFAEHRIAQRCTSYDIEVLLRESLKAQGTSLTSLPKPPNIQGLDCESILSKVPSPP